MRHDSCWRERVVNKRLQIKFRKVKSGLLAANSIMSKKIREMNSNLVSTAGISQSLRI